MLEKSKKMMCSTLIHGGSRDLLSQQQAIAGYNSWGFRAVVLFILVWAAVVSVLNCQVSLVNYPLGGLIVSLMAMFCSFRFKDSLILRLIIVYLAGVSVNQAMLVPFKFQLNGIIITFMGHLPVMLIVFVVFCKTYKDILRQNEKILTVSLISIFTILIHIIFLYGILRRGFGFGYEDSLGIFVDIVIFCIFISTLLVVLKDKITLRGVSIILCCYFASMTLFAG